MIYLRLQGGLGNQLFILAMALHLSEKTNRRVGLVSNRRVPHKVIKELAGLNQHRVKLVSSPQIMLIFKSLGWVLSSQKKLANFLNAKNWFFVEIQNKKLVLEDLYRASFIEGYFQRAWIVDSIWDQIGSKLLNVLNNLHGEIDLSIRSKRVIHVRRGDYRHHASIFGLLTREYYEGLIADLENVSGFTDMTLEEAESFFDSTKVVLYTPDQVDETKVLWELAHAEVVIIANSSLSWWGGYLAAKEGARVIAPKPWFKCTDHWSEEIFPANFLTEKSVFSDESTS